MGFSCRYGAGVFFLSFSFFPLSFPSVIMVLFSFLLGVFFCNGLAVVRVNMLHARCNVSFLQFMFGVLKKREWGVGRGGGGRGSDWLLSLFCILPVGIVVFFFWSSIAHPVLSAQLAGLVSRLYPKEYVPTYSTLYSII